MAATGEAATVDAAATTADAAAANAEMVAAHARAQACVPEWDGTVNECGRDIRGRRTLA